MQVRIGITRAMGPMLVVGAVAAVPASASDDAPDSAATSEPAVTSEPSSTSVPPAPTSESAASSAPAVTSERISDGVVVQTVALDAGVADVNVPAVTPPEWASAQARSMAQDEPDVLTEPLSVDPFHLAAVTWRGDRPVTAWVRTRSDGEWSPWYQLPDADDHGPDPGSAEAEEARQGTDPLLVDSSDGVQVRVSAPGGGTLPADVRLDLVNAEVDGGDADARADDGRLPTAEAYGAPQPTMYSRAAWGADESLRKGSPQYGVVDGGFVHHTVSATNYTEAQVPAMIRSIYAYHVNGRGWNDIGYNFLVDRFGRVWEGRYGGVGRAVIGAHTRGYNDDAFAMSAIGTYTSATPPSAMITAYQRLFAWKFTAHGVDPRYPAYYDGDRFNPVSGHRDAAATACPGDALYARLSTIRSGIVDRMALEPSRDINRDIGPDLMLTKSDGTVWWSPGNRRGGYRTPLRLGSGWHLRRAPVVIGDLDRNGWDDLLTVDARDDALVIYRGQSGATFASRLVLATRWSGVDLMAAPGDATGDGLPDVVVRNRPGDTWLYPGRSDGRLSGARIAVRSDWSMNDQIVGVGDMNGDRHVDLVAKNRTSGNVYLVPGRGDGTFGTPQRIASGWHGWTIVGAADMNLDGRPDLAVRKPDGVLWRYPGNGRGGFGTPVRLSAGWNAYNRLF